MKASIRLIRSRGEDENVVTTQTKKWDPYREWQKIYKKERHVTSSQSHRKTEKTPHPMRTTRHGHQNGEWVLTTVYHVR